MFTTYDWFGYELPIKERYRKIKQAGFDGVLMWWSEFFGRGKDYRSGPEIARAAGLHIENIHAPTMTPSGIWFDEHLWLDNLNGESGFECYMQCIADCAVYEVPTMVMHLPSDKVPPTPLGLDRIKKLAEKAERLRVNVAMENIANLNNLTYMLDHINSPRMGFCYDAAHHCRIYPKIDLLEMFGHRMMALHLHDNLDRTTHRLPFDGNINWPLVMSKVAKANYKGAIAIEATNLGLYDDLPVEAFLRRAYDGAKKLGSLAKERG